MGLKKYDLCTLPNQSTVLDQVEIYSHSLKKNRSGLCCYFFSVGDCKHLGLFVAVYYQSVPSGGAIKQGVKHRLLEFLIALLRRSSNCLSHVKRVANIPYIVCKCKYLIKFHVCNLRVWNIVC